MPTTPIDVFLAALPPTLVLILMVGFSWGGSKAGAVGWLAALIIALVRFGAGAEVLTYAHIRSLILTIDVVYIVWSALLLYLVVDQSGAMQVIADWFTNLTSDETLRVLLLGWVFTSFLQGVGGFGVPIAIVAPLMVGLGLSPLRAILIPSIGHTWSVAFGSLGASHIAITGTTGIDGQLIIPPAALLLGVTCLVSGMLVAQAYSGWKSLFHALPAIFSIGIVMSVVQYLLAANNLWSIASAGGSLAGLAFGLWVTRWPFYNRIDAESVKIAPQEGKPSFPQAISSYMILVVLAVLIVGVEPIKDFFGQVTLGLDIPEVETSKGWVTPASSNLGIKIFGHTGAVLVYTATIAYSLYLMWGYYKTGALPVILKGVRKRGVNPAIGILTMVAMATIMSNVGMTRTLAEWLSQAVPADLYAVVATTIGALGAFMTGSNTNSNAVFSVLQMDTANLLGLSVPLILATQTSAASIASMLAPAKIIVGASTVGMTGDEGTVLRNLLLYGGALLAIVALLTFILIQAGL